MIKIKVDNNNYFKRLDKFLRHQLKESSLSYIYALIRKGKVRINNQVIKQHNYTLNISDEIEINEKIENFNSTQKKKNFNNIQFNLPIIYEDEYILVINKPNNLAVHQGSEIKNFTLIDMLNSYGNQNNFEPFLVHRLDKPTSGIMLIAKSREISRKLTEIIKERKIDKTYIAIILGDIYPQKAILEDIIDNQTAKLEYRKIDNTLINNYKLALLEIKLYTGRKHQIRKQLSQRNYPILGDNKYGDFKINKWFDKNFNTKNILFLHAHKILFPHPIYNEKIFFEAPIPEYFKIFFPTSIENI